MDDYINELKAEAEASMLKTVEKMLKAQTKCGISDAVYWARIARDVNEFDTTLRKERKEKRDLLCENKKLKEEIECEAINKALADVADLEFRDDYVRMEDFEKLRAELIATRAKYREETGILAGNVKLVKREKVMNKFAMEVHNLTFGTDYDDPDIATSFHFETILERMRDNEVGLIDEVTKLGIEVTMLKESRRPLEVEFISSKSAEDSDYDSDDDDEETVIEILRKEIKKLDDNKKALRSKEDKLKSKLLDKVIGN
tara:strand:+ start:252 stop:1025 length:774 start_codon:yes stop_codon:yes gene_type:complete